MTGGMLRCSTRARQGVCLLAVVLSLLAAPTRVALALFLSGGVAEIYGYVWHDWNENGHWDSGEAYLADVLMILADLKGTPLASVRTGPTGVYRFAGLEAGTYLVSETDPEGFASTTPNLVTLEVSTQACVRQDFGDTYAPVGCFRVIDGIVWQDVNANGKRETNEGPLEGVAVRMLNLEHRVVALTTSNAYGNYALRAPVPERYHIAITPPASAPLVSVPTYWGVDLRGCYPAVIDFGLYKRAPSTFTALGASGTGNSTVSGGIWRVDYALNGAVRSRQAMVGVRLTLLDASGRLIGAQYSDMAGQYRFEGLKWQHYYLIQEALPTHEPLLANAWGLAPTDQCEILIDFENRPLPGYFPPPIYFPFVTLNR